MDLTVILVEAGSLESDLCFPDIKKSGNKSFT